MKRLKPIRTLIIKDRYLLPYLNRSAETVLPALWRQLDDKGFLDNFKVAGMNAFGFYRGPADADACVHDWAAAALKTVARKETSEAAREDLNRKLETYIRLVTAAQDESGYLYTFKQICDPSQKWKRLFAEREWLCMGAFIETAVIHGELTEKTELLNAAEKCADLFLAEFGKTEDTRTAAFSRMERPLFLLSRAVGNDRFTFLANELTERRTRQKAPGVRFFFESLQLNRLKKNVLKSQLKLLGKTWPIESERWEIFPEERKRLRLRSFIDTATGTRFQMNRRKPALEKTCGNAANYLEILRGRLADPNADDRILSDIENRWNDIILNHAYLTGGVGVNALTGGFGKPGDLPAARSVAAPETAFETAALSLELYMRTGRIFYIDFYEWIFFNLILTTADSEGIRFFSRHLHESDGGFGRRENPVHLQAPLSFAKALAFYPETVVFQDDDGDLYIDQYISAEVHIEEPELTISMTASESDSFQTVILVDKKTARDLTLFLRIPGWAVGYRITLNGTELESMPNILFGETGEVPHYFNGNRFPVNLSGKGKNEITVDFPKIIRSHSPRRSHKTDGDVFAVSRGKFLYCAEEADNRHSDFNELNLNLQNDFTVEKSYDFFDSLVIDGKDENGGRVRLVPYHLWNNRGDGKMKIRIKNRISEEIPDKSVRKKSEQKDRK